MASNMREVAVRSGVDPAEEPSVDWGWHGRFPKGIKIAGISTAVALLLMLIGHETSWTERLWMGIPALICLLGVGYLVLRQRHSWRN
ncbi:DUF2631 domain-containing protein [Pseudonocardia phyllosphaerae]|uniref:DUF2631 domain-containing protein n=1 Tax=Pseudonocardia phyllosphaerae TaxID=3390502 RepID=UPI00397B1EDE